MAGKQEPKYVPPEHVVKEIREKWPAGIAHPRSIAKAHGLSSHQITVAIDAAYPTVEQREEVQTQYTLRSSIRRATAKHVLPEPILTEIIRNCLSGTETNIAIAQGLKKLQTQRTEIDAASISTKSPIAILSSPAPAKDMYSEIRPERTYSTDDLYSLHLDLSEFERGQLLLADNGWSEDKIFTKYGRIKGDALLAMLPLLGKRKKLESSEGRI